eukprot:668612_1
MQAGHSHVCAISTSDEVKCWGGNTFGELGLENANNRGDAPGEMSDFLPIVDLGFGFDVWQVAAGAQHSCALSTTGSVKCWGMNNYGQLGIGNTLSKGHYVGEMGSSLPPVVLGSSFNPVKIVVQSYSSCALSDANAVKCWGKNNKGQLGYGDVQRRGDDAGEMGDNLATVDLGSLFYTEDMQAGHSHVCAISTSDEVKCWGGNTFGELGLENANNRGDAPGEMSDFLPIVDLGYSTTDPSISPTEIPTINPSNNPTNSPSKNPTNNPSTPTSNPTSPSTPPSISPTVFPSRNPLTTGQTAEPAQSPTRAPTTSHSNNPTSPSTPPSINPTVISTLNPSSNPTTSPSNNPSKSPSKSPTMSPSKITTISTLNPSTFPTIAPSAYPTTPTNRPIKDPTRSPSANPTISPSNDPTAVPTIRPTQNPLGTGKTAHPTQFPTVTPSNNPTDNPSVNPTLNPTLAPTVNPSIDPSLDPTKTPSMNPSYNPTLVPTRDPSTTYNPTLYPTVPTIAVDDICSEWSISITFTIQTKNTMNGPQLETVLNANCANAFTKTIRRNVTQWNNDWCIAIDITVRIAARRRRQLLQQSSNDFTVDAQFMMNDILFTDVFMDYDANAFGDTFEKEFAESLSRNGVISNGGVSALTISDAIDISSSTTDKGTFFVDFGDGITVVLFTLISATILTVIIGKINSKLFSGPDDFRWAFVFVFGVYSWDIVSDWLFAVSLYNGYIARSSGSDYVVYVILFIASLFFIMMPIASNFRCLYVFQSRWQRNPLHGERYKAWFEEYGTAVYALSLICGSTFGAIQVVNSNLAQFRFFTMGLTLFELNEFRQARIVNVVLIENVPQLLIQCIFSVQSNGLSTISILAIMSSVVSICVSFLDHISKRQLLTDEKVSYSLFAFNVYCIGMSEFANKYKFKTKQLGLEIAKMFKALDKKAIQVLPSQLISHERHGDGLIISFQVATASIKPQQLFDELMAAAAKPSVNDDVLSLLARQILKSWKLEVSNEFDLVIDNMQWITEQQVLDKQKTIQLQMSTMLQAQETQD